MFEKIGNFAIKQRIWIILTWLAAAVGPAPRGGEIAQRVNGGTDVAEETDILTRLGFYAS